MQGKCFRDWVFELSESGLGKGDHVLMVHGVVGYWGVGPGLGFAGLEDFC